MRKITLFFAIVIIINSALWAQSSTADYILLTEQIEIDNFPTNYPNITDIEGDLIIHGEDIANLDSLSVLTSLSGGLSIYGTYLLTDLSGLENVTFLSEHLNLWNNEGMINLTGLENITSLNGEIEIISNGILENLEGLNNLTHVDGLIRIHYNDNINSMSGLNSLTFIGGSFTFLENKLLEDLSPLNNLEFIGNGLTFYDNDLLVNIDGFSNLTYLAGDLRFEYNDILIDISGVANIESSEISHLIIAENPLLSECDITTICNYLEVPTNTTYIANNKIGCNSRAEVEEACLVGIPKIENELSFSIYPNPASNKIYLTNDNNVEISNIDIISIHGKVCIENTRSINNSIDISQLYSGVYFLKCHTKQGIYVSKFIVK